MLRQMLHNGENIRSSVSIIIIYKLFSYAFNVKFKYGLKIINSILNIIIIFRGEGLSTNRFIHSEVDKKLQISNRLQLAKEVTSNKSEKL